MPDPPVVRVAVGERHSCAVQPSGEVECWGWGERGDLGPGERTSSEVPRRVAGIDDAIDVAIALRSCALRRSGRVYCWGYGVGGRPESVEGADLDGLDDAIAIDTANGSVCALRRSGSIACLAWDGTSAPPRLFPVEGLDDARQLGGGCARRANGEWSCWTSSRMATPDPSVPRGARDVARLVEQDTYSDGVGSGTYIAVLGELVTTCAAIEGAPPQCWGNGQRGLLGQRPGDAVELAQPTPVPGVPEASRIAITRWQACAIASGEVWCWGYPSYRPRDLEVPSAMPIPPVRVGAIDDAIDIAVGDMHACAARRSGRIACWGTSDDGRTGDGDRIERIEP